MGMRTGSRGLPGGTHKAVWRGPATLTGTLLAALLSLGAGVTTPATAATAAPGRAFAVTPAATQTTAPTAATACRRAPVVYLVPHQDDEVLSMGASIRRSLNRSGQACVHVVLVTTGQSSGARGLMARGFKAAGQQRFTAFTLSKAQFAASRDAEFRAALAKLGMSSRNVHLGLPRAPRVADDGSLTPAVAERFVNAAIDQFGRGAGYATMSDSDPVYDHRTLGVALRKVGRARKVGSISFFYPPYQLPAPRRLSPTVASGADRTALRNAALEYGRFAPASRRYGIGWLSVSRQFGGPALQTRFMNADRSATFGVRPMPAPKIPLMNGYTSLLHR